jgi:membrane glycosyltransferase
MKKEYLKPGNLMRYELFIIVGIFMVIGTLIKLTGIYDFSSDWFWFLAGIGLIVEGIISLIKQRKFDKKFRIIEKENN